tara:strand:- start:204 stop:458 length:255 start_codon:yes stop_codon:yes gene_type:complete
MPVPKRVAKTKAARTATGKKPRLKLQIAKGLDALKAVPSGIISDADQTILRRIQNIHRSVGSGTLKATDLANMKKIAAKHRVSF